MARKRLPTLAPVKPKSASSANATARGGCENWRSGWKNTRGAGRTKECAPRERENRTISNRWFLGDFRLALTAAAPESRLVLPPPRRQGGLWSRTDRSKRRPRATRPLLAEAGKTTVFKGLQLGLGKNSPIEPQWLPGLPPKPVRPVHLQSWRGHGRSRARVAPPPWETRQDFRCWRSTVCLPDPKLA
jgi:hypothetical protein